MEGPWVTLCPNESPVDKLPIQEVSESHSGYSVPPKVYSLLITLFGVRASPLTVYKFVQIVWPAQASYNSIVSLQGEWLASDWKIVVGNRH